MEGVHDVAGSMFNEMYQSLFKGKKTYELLRDVVLSRLVYPCSKRRTDLSLLVSKFASKTAIIPGMSAGTAASTVKLLILECVLIALFPTRDITDLALLLSRSFCSPLINKALPAEFESALPP